MYRAVKNFYCKSRKIINQNLKNTGPFYCTHTLWKRSLDCKEERRGKITVSRNVKGCVTSDSIKSDDISEEVNVSAIRDKFNFYTQRWRNHLNRLSDERLPKSLFYYHPRGRRNIGEPRKSCTGTAACL